jgi:hypothetical protein
VPVAVSAIAMADLDDYICGSQNRFYQGARHSSGAVAWPAGSRLTHRSESTGTIAHTHTLSHTALTYIMYVHAESYLGRGRCPAAH